VLTLGINITTTYPDYILLFRNTTFIERLSRRVGQDRNCHRKECLFYC